MLTPVPFTKVKFTDSFWAPRIRTNRAVTLPIEYKICEETGRLGAFDWRKGQPHEPHWFWDSDAAKWIEAASYALADERDPQVEAQIDAYAASLIRNQLPDGYANSRFINVEPGAQWANLRDAHEMYCAGHMIEAAVAYFEATGKRELLDAMCRYADHMIATFGPNPGQKRGYCGHQEIELALIKLYRATGQRKYLDLAAFFINERGQGTSLLHPDKPGAHEHFYDVEAKARNADPRDYWAKNYEYLQAHKPVREQTEVVGHAVRAMYMLCAMADLSAELKDDTLLHACEALWTHLTTRRMYVTGGIGSGGANEGFTADYDLPDDTAYCETCAAVGLVFWAHRMLQLTGQSKYADVMERALYNGALAGISLDGAAFFYANPLSSAGNVLRQAWWDCACCPPNIARLIASVSGYQYSSSGDGIWAHLYAQGEAEMRVGQTPVRVSQTTNYPWDGAIALRLSLEKPAAFAVHLRIPDWCDGFRISINQKPIANTQLQDGYLVLSRLWADGDTIELELNMPAQYVYANPNVRQALGQVALQRGPLMYCVEQADNGAQLDRIILPSVPDGFAAAHEPGLLGGVTVLRGDAIALDESSWGGALYRHAAPSASAKQITAVPYYAWANRAPGEMRVWLRAQP
ncbi:MAG TPA: glycoside hydrolase family 127 protein [Thermoflexales bacterium]|nr:glycoside hydrolase family 127 protein [Thermoflexales bacterium]